MVHEFCGHIGPVRRIAAALTVAVLLGPISYAAARPQPHPADPTPHGQTLHDAVALAWARLPQRDSLAARQATAAARYTSGGALLPNAPSANGTYVNDKIAGSNYNYITTQLEVDTPVWLPGEGTATQRLAQADSTAIQGAAEAAHLALAAQVLELATQATLATGARDVAARRLATNRALAADLARRFAVGESSQSDALAADAEAATAEVSLGQAEAQLEAARVALAAVTGTAAIPALDPPSQAASKAPAEILASHPRVAAAEQAVEAARANVRLVRIQDRDDPEVGVTGINEKQPGTRWDTRFGVTVHFHFATEARNAPLRAAAEQTLTQAEVQAVMARREVGAAIGRAQAILAGTERGSAAAERAAAELEKRRGQIERAWRLGEMPLIELVRANALAFDAAYARDKTRTERASALIGLQLAQGALP